MAAADRPREAEAIQSPVVGQELHVPTYATGLARTSRPLPLAVSTKPLSCGGSESSTGIINLLNRLLT